MLQQAIQVLLTTIWVLFASPISGAITPQGWYYLGAGMAALQFVVALLWLPETKYDRNLSAYQEDVSSDDSTEAVDLEADIPDKAKVTLCKEKPPLDFVNYAPRTWRSDMRLWVGKPEWYKAVEVLKVSPWTCLSLRQDRVDTSKSKPSSFFSSPTSFGHYVSMDSLSASILLLERHTAQFLLEPRTTGPTQALAT
jgi:hypothetical protein